MLFSLLRKLGSSLPFTKKTLSFFLNFLPNYIKVNHSKVALYINPRDIKNLIDAIIPTENNNRMCELFSFLLDENHTVIDVGGNIGLFTILAAKKAKKVYVFEPDPDCLENIKKNITYYSLDNVILSNKALSNEKGEKSFFKDDYYSTLGSFSKKNIDHNSQEFIIETVKLDDFVNSKKIDGVDIIKLNIQGAEGYAIEGGKELISRELPIILIEFWPYGLESTGYKPITLINFFKTLGYQFTQFDQNTLDLQTKSIPDLENMCLKFDRNSVSYFLLQNPNSRNFYKNLDEIISKKYNGIN